MNTFAMRSFVSVALAILSSTVVAQVQPPVRAFLDANGVDLLTGEMTSVYRGPSIGSGAGRLGFTRTFRAKGIWDSYLGVITSSGSVYSVTLDGITERFTASGGIFTPLEGNGSTLTLSGGTYTYITGVGTVATYDVRPADIGWPGHGWPGSNPVNASLTNVTYPDGERLNTEYHQQSICIAHMGGCSPQLTAVRIKWVTSNRGYRLAIDYFMNSSSVGDPVMFVTPQTIRLLNLGDGSTVSSVGILVSIPNGSGTNWMELTDALGRTTRFNRTDANGITSIRRPGSTFDDVTASFWNTTLVSNVTKDGLGSGYFYWDQGTNPVVRTTTVTEPGGSESFVTIDATRQRLLSSGDALDRTTTLSYQYDAQGILSLMRVTEPEGNFVEYTYDVRGNVKDTVLGAKSGGATILAARASFDATCVNRKTCNKPHSVIDARGNQTDFTYFPDHGGLHKITLPAPTSGAARPETRFSYSSLQAWFQGGPSGEPIHLLTGTSTCRNSVATACPNTNDELNTTIDYGPTTGVPNNLLPRTVTTSNGSGTLASVTGYAYDAAGNLLTVDGPISGTSDTIRTRYDALRRVVGVVGPDPDGGGWRPHVAARNTYNTAGDLVAIEKGTVTSQSDPDWANFVTFETVSLVYDTAGRRLRSTLSSGGTTYAIEQMTYDFLGRLECVARRMNPATFTSLPSSACTMGASGNFGFDRITKFGFDAATQVTTVTTGHGMGTGFGGEIVSSRTYTVNGKPETVTDGKGNLTKYVYDNFDRLSQTLYPDPDDPGSFSETDFEQRGYDANSNVTSVRVRNGDVIGFVFDALNRIDLKDLPSGEDVYFSYDNHGRLLTARHGSPTGPGIVQTYDGLGRPDLRTSFGRTLDYDYDAAGRRTRVTHPDAFYARYFYNVAGELTAIDDSTGVTLATFTYDALGRPDTITRGNGTLTDFGHDAVSRLNLLISDLASTNYDGTSTFGHSPAHQITSHTQTNDAIYSWAPPGNSNTVTNYNGLNQLTLINPSTSVDHDPLGNLETGASTFAFGYDLDNRLRSADSASTAVSLAYDPLGQLSEVMVNGASTKFLYDGLDLVAEYDDTGALLRRYVHGGGIDQPLVWYEGAGTTDRRYFHADERGSIVAISNNSGAGTVSFKYSPDGEAINAASSRFGYTGQVSLAQIGLCYYKSRMYSPKLGRFLQTDAIGYAGGMNLYAYADGDAINHIDPLGFDVIVTAARQIDWWLWGQSREIEFPDPPDFNDADGQIDNSEQAQQKAETCAGLADRNAYRMATTGTAVLAGGVTGGLLGAAIGFVGGESVVEVTRNLGVDHPVTQFVNGLLGIATNGPAGGVGNVLNDNLSRGWQDSAYPVVRAVGASTVAGAAGGAMVGGWLGAAPGAAAGAVDGGVIGFGLGLSYFGIYAYTWNKTFDRCMSQ